MLCVFFVITLEPQRRGEMFLNRLRKFTSPEDEFKMYHVIAKLKI